RIKLLQEELGAVESERTGRSLFLLTVFTVLALPINIIAGLFGMNVGGVPFGDAPNGFWVVTGALAAVMGAVAWWVFGRNRK
ncbi:MAG TPA: CorA family divalent cation transporter, partial [Ramlibacter sp.]|nr:CorA family divalent cation transporter [Ramlibacter sp.]